MNRPRETDLYAPVKTFLEAQGYAVKAEVGPADVMAVRGEEDPLFVELKTGFTLTLVHQGIARQALSDWVYLAVPRGTGRTGARALKANTALCRRLGLGFLSVRLRDGLVEVLCDPAPFRPRKAPVRRGRLLREFARRIGDPNTGGATRVGLVTAYRQDALCCARHLLAGPCKGSDVAAATGVARATRLMADDHYGWFARISRGVYDLTPRGRADVEQERADGA